MKDKIKEIRRRADPTVDLNEYWDSLKCQEDRRTLLKYIAVIDAQMEARSDLLHNQVTSGLVRLPNGR